MSGSEFGSLSESNEAGAVSVYCMATLVAEEASRNGFLDLAKSMEHALGSFLSGLTRDEQRRALRLSYEMALGSMERDLKPAPRLRLVYSRD